MDKNVEEQQDERDQLRSLLSELDENSVSNQEVTNDWHEDLTVHHVDILNLPPRKEIHGQKNSNMRIKFTRPFIRLSFVILILVGLIIFAIYYWM